MLPLRTGLVVYALATVTSCARTEEGASRAAAESAALEALQVQVAYLRDRQQIQDLYVRYMRGFDRNDRELLRSAFWPDAQINNGRESNTPESFLASHLDKHVNTVRSWAHLLTNQHVELDGDIAHVEIIVTSLSSRDKSMVVSGRYIDRVDRRNGEWRIAVREFIPHFVAEMPATIDSYLKADWTPSPCGLGTRDRRDPSYARPLTPRKDKTGGAACADAAP